jgi:chromate transporter
MANEAAVERRGWLTPEQFSDGLAVCEMLPGPASTQMGIYIGYVRGGLLGALVAGVAFITPAFAIVVGLAWVYFRFQQLPQLAALFFGLSPVMIAIILGFCWKLGQKSVRDWTGGAIAILTLLLSQFTDLSTLLLFVIFGLVGLLAYGPRSQNWLGLLVAPLLANLPVAQGLAPARPLDHERMRQFFWPLLGFFLKVGAFIFGGGLVIIPLLEFEVVDRLQWLTRQEFLDGIAIGQLSPGPVVITAAFVGYKVAGLLGALVSTVGIFTPSFLFIMAAAPLLLKLRQNPWIQAFLKGVRPAVLGAIAAATIPLAKTAVLQETWFLSSLALAIGMAALIALIRFRMATWQLILAGATVGLVVYPLS